MLCKRLGSVERYAMVEKKQLLIFFFAMPTEGSKNNLGIARGRFLVHLPAWHNFAIV